MKLYNWSKLKCRLVEMNSLKATWERWKISKMCYWCTHWVYVSFLERFYPEFMGDINFCTQLYLSPGKHTLDLSSLITLLPRVIFRSHKSLQLIPTVFWGYLLHWLCFLLVSLGVEWLCGCLLPLNRLSWAVNHNARIAWRAALLPRLLTNLQPEHDIWREV